MKNKGFDKGTIDEYKKKIFASGKNFILDGEDENSEEYAHFFFIGTHEGEEVIFDGVLYTLRLQHESELFDVAEQRALQQFPHYEKLTYEGDENEDLKKLKSQEEQIGLYLAEVMVELNEEDSIKVSEHVELDIDHEFGIGLDAGLNIEAVTAEIIQRFIDDFNADKLSLDDTLYSFQLETDD
ncbi:MAG: hypothetical protein JNM78_05925 [Cyclobacteriaceae bacterium]|nr:hypothetical protein [Cyclobacteriaceae bacterium]